MVEDNIWGYWNCNPWLSMYGYRTHHQVVDQIRLLITSNTATRRAAEPTNPIGEVKSDSPPSSRSKDQRTDFGLRYAVVYKSIFGFSTVVGTQWAVRPNKARLY